MATRKIGTVKGAGTFEDHFETDLFGERHYVRERPDPDSNYKPYGNNKYFHIKDPVERKIASEFCRLLFGF